MIVRKRLYQCDHCPRKAEFKWQEDYPETMKCQCGSKLRIIGYGDGKTTRMIMKKKFGMAHETEYWDNAQVGKEY